MIENIQQQIFDFIHKDAAGAVIKALIAWESSQPIANAMNGMGIKVDFAKHDQVLFFALLWATHRIHTLYTDSKKATVAPTAVK